ncbi:hypothetical protein NM208_g3444 [Fusarium decemcellulare]|uniref:Uncharacterized protein n=2 Tax=Fusarium decemcellulare TaxID=57161 RepID=A0ACC1SMX8_9HYPO|nr:hypothetical protein NM208_g3868 [Fusarium decemcellulare]KAJ3543680.1 hypothetical protein NM208_g3444 [Fusarium decemcellulare]
MSKIRNVAVVGGTGYIGTAIVDALLEAKLNVSIVTRDANSPKSQNAKAPVVQSEYTLASLTEIFTGQDAVISAVSVGPAILTQRTMIDAAVKAGVSRFIPSEYGSSSQDIRIDDFKKLMAPKVQIIDYLKQVASENPTFAWSCLGSGALLDNGLKSGTWGFSLSDRAATIFDSGNARFDSTVLPEVASAVVSILRNPDITTNRYLVVRNFVVSQSEILGALEEAMGSKWTRTYLDSNETKKKGWELLQSGNPAAGIPKIIQGSLFHGDSNVATPADQLDNRLLGVAKLDLREYIERLI